MQPGVHLPVGFAQQPGQQGDVVLPESRRRPPDLQRRLGQLIGPAHQITRPDAPFRRVLYPFQKVAVPVMRVKMHLPPAQHRPGCDADGLQSVHQIVLVLRCRPFGDGGVNCVVARLPSGQRPQAGVLR